MPVLGYLGFPPFALECYAHVSSGSAGGSALISGRGRPCYNPPAHARIHTLTGGQPMKAVRIHAPGGPEAMRLEDVPSPSRRPAKRS